MKMMYGNVPIKSLNVKHYEMSTSDATAQSSDLQAGMTCYARGQRVTGSGKAFSFATYGQWRTNESDIVPEIINVVHIGSTDYPIRMTARMEDMVFYDFSIPQEVAEVIINEVAYPITVSVQDGEFLVACEHTIDIELFFGKDRHI